MTITDRTYRPRPPRQQENITPGRSSLPNPFLAARSLESHGSFILPWLQPGQHVLDCGCGPGTLTLGLSEQVFPGHVTGLDIHPGLIKQAERLAFGLEQVNTSFRTGSIYSLPFEDHAFDLVFAHALFEELSSPLEALKECRRVLRPDGLIALCSPDWDQLRLEPHTESVQEALSTCRELQTRHGGNPGAGTLLSNWLQEAGFHLLSEESRLETCENTPRIGEYLAKQLDEHNEPLHASNLRDWSSRPGSHFSLAWTGVVGL